MSERRTRGNDPETLPAREVYARFSDAVLAVDEEFRVTYLNERAEDVLETSEEAIAGEVLWDELPDGVRSEFREAFERAMETQESVTFEGYHAPRDRWFDVQVCPSETGISVSLRDATDRVHRRTELEHRERALREAYEIIADTDMTFSEQIDALLEVVREAVGTDYATFSCVSKEDYVFEAVDVPADVALEAGDTVPLDELPNCKHVVETEQTLVLRDVEAEAPEFADPTWGIACYLGAPVVVGDEVYGTFCFYGMEARSEAFTDWEVTFVDFLSDWVSSALATERRTRRRDELIEQLEESNDRLEQFAYAASHDLQEPLRMVSSYLKLIEDRYADELDADGEEFIEFAVDGADRMREMIDGLLEYSRVETRGDPFEPVHLEEVVADARKDSQVAIEESDAEVTVESLPSVHGDASQLAQVFQNLLCNAIEYSGDDPPEIRVAAERHGEKWRVSVSDDGIGIDPDDSDRVFEVFQRLHTADEHPGTGIGLALCRRIVERHDGRIWVDPEPGEGSTFHLTLPRPPAE